jgi:hypothetical protein
MAIDPGRTPASRSRYRFCGAGCLVTLLAFGPMGCSDHDLPAGLSRRVVEVKDVPQPVMKAAKKALPGVTFKDAWANLDRDKKLHSYEIRGRTSNGKISEVRVSPTGEILEME